MLEEHTKDLSAQEWNLICHINASDLQEIAV